MKYNEELYLKAFPREEPKGPIVNPEDQMVKPIEEPKPQQVVDTDPPIIDNGNAGLSEPTTE